MKHERRERRALTRTGVWTAAVALGAVGNIFIGCKTAHPLGPVLTLYAKDGGPAFEKAPGTYDPLVVDRFFEAHPAVLPSFVDHGVCSLKTDPKSEEATANGIICQSAVSVSFGIGMRKFSESNR